MTISTRTFEQDGLTYTVKWVIDENPDLSWLGEYQKDVSDYCVDRREGVLLGEWVEEPEEPNPDDFDSDEAFTEYACTTYARQYDAWDQHHGREVLATGLTTDHDRHSYRFFGQFQHLPHNKNSWDHVTPEQLQQALDANKAKIARYGIAGFSTMHQLDQLYAVLDYERIEDYNRGGWCMLGCVVEVTARGYDVGYASVWGIESDSEDSYREQIESELIGEATLEALKAPSGLLGAVAAIEQAREAQKAAT